MAVTDSLAPVLGTFVSGFSNSWIKWLIIVTVVICGVGAVIWFYRSQKKEKKKWNKTIRVWSEEPITKRILIRPYAIKGAGLTINGTRMIYLKKPLKGAKLLPLINYYSEPGVIDIILTADDRFFQFTGFTGINKQRKELGIGIRYPGIDAKFDRINKQYASMSNTSGLDRTMEIIKKLTPMVIIICILIMFIVGGNYWIQAKKTDTVKTQAELELMGQMSESSIINKQAADVQLEFWNSIKGQFNLKGAPVSAIVSEEIK